ncbi:hypothetical protein [Nocardioides pacificus]
MPGRVAWAIYADVLALLVRAQLIAAGVAAVAIFVLLRLGEDWGLAVILGSVAGGLTFLAVLSRRSRQITESLLRAPTP